MPFQVLFASYHVHRIDLDTLGPIADLSLGLALMVLTTKAAQAPAMDNFPCVSLGVLRALVVNQSGILPFRFRR